MELLALMFLLCPMLFLVGFITYVHIRHIIDERKHYNEYKANGYSYNPKPEEVKLEKRKEIINKILNNGKRTF